MVSRYRRRAPPVSRTTPFKKGVSPTLQIRQQVQDAEKIREKDYQNRRRQLQERIQARIKQLEEYKSQLIEVKLPGKPKTKEEAQKSVKSNVKQVSEKKTYVDQAGKEVKLDKKALKIQVKTTNAISPSKVRKNPNTWVKIDFDGDKSDQFNQWTRKDLQNTMELLIRQGEATSADKSDIAETTQNTNSFIVSEENSKIMDGAQVIYDRDSGEIWAKEIPDDLPKEAEFTETEVERIFTSDNPDGYIMEDEE
tara:strand:+ start:436 stop:1191 length:756 start_codon:yes stop_codon:yes gene_type:complete